MKKAWPVLPAAVLVGGALYGALASVKVGDPDTQDRWLKAWEEAGLQAQIRSTRERFKLVEARKTLEESGYEGTTLRDYRVKGVSVQVAELPSEDLLPEISEGRHMRFRLGKKGRGVHLSRVGRLILMISTQTRAGDSRRTVPEDFVTRTFEAFEEAAAP